MMQFPKEMRHDSGAMMVLDESRLLLAFKAPVKHETIAARIRDFDLELEDEGNPERGDPEMHFGRINHTSQRLWVRERGGRAIDAERGDALTRALGAKLDWIGPVYRLSAEAGPGGMVCPLPKVLLVRPNQRTGTERNGAFAKRMRRYGLEEVKEKSAYLGDFHYFVLPDSERSAYELRDELSEAERGAIAAAYLENMPMVVPTTLVPTDTHYARQWNMTRIQAGGMGTTGWDISTGAAGVIVCVLDQGCDLTHPDLIFAGGAAGQGINLGTMMPTGGPTGSHGTACAGIAVGAFNNAAGVSGVAGSCSLMPVAFENWTDAECAAGINWAAANGAAVISMSFGVYAPGEGFNPTGWNFAVIDPAIVNAANVNGCVLVAATGNENTGTVNRYPARHNLVVAVGGTDQADTRKTPMSTDGECWGANFGPGISVVAPCVLCPTTDIQAGGGYNTNNGGARMVACINYANCGDAGGDYFFQFNGTSSATPHVAGLAGVVRSFYPTLTNQQVRTLIERTAEKVGGAYADAAGFANGTRNANTGYGRINMFRALDFADVMIKDYPADIGAEPSTPPGGNFWTFADVVVRINDDNVFDPGDPSKSSNVERGQTNYIYVRVTNSGPREARNVVVTARITPYVGLEFVYPTDWTATDATHVGPASITASFATIPSGGTVIAKFSVTAAQVETLWGWISGNNWHPCLLAAVTADNDYAFGTASLTGGSLTTRRNNLAQRNLSVIDVLATATASFSFVAGNVANKARFFELLVDRSRLPRAMPLLLDLEADGATFPLVDFSIPGTPEPDDEGIVFLDKTRIETKFGCCRGVMTLERGSRLDCPKSRRVGEVKVTGGEVVLRDGKRFVDVRDDIAVIGIEKQPGQMIPLALTTTIPADAKSDRSFAVNVAQRDERGDTVGGAGAIWRVRS